MKNKKIFSVGSITLAVLVIIRSLYYVIIQKSALDIIIVSFVASLIAGMYIVRFLSKDKRVACLPKNKNIWAGIFAILTEIFLIVDGIYWLFHIVIDDLGSVYNGLFDLLELSNIHTFLLFNSLVNFGFAVVLIILAIEHFTGNKKMSEKNILLFIPMIWGCTRLLKFVFIDGHWATSAIKGVEIIGVVFLVFNLLSILKMHSHMYRPKHFIKLTTQACISIPIVITSSTFGIIDALSSPVKCNIISYIIEICLAMFVFFTIRATKPTDISECEKNYYFDFKSMFIPLNIATLFIACVSIICAFFRISFVRDDNMIDTLYAKDKLVIYSFMYKPKSGDIVLINPFEYLTSSGYDIYQSSRIRRVVAVEGQTLHIEFDNQKVYVDGKELNEPYEFTFMTKMKQYSINDRFIIPEKIPEGYVLVMGDNSSYLAHNWYSELEIRLVPIEEVRGKVIFRYSPLDQMKMF